jgi:hypothetical protein
MEPIKSTDHMRRSKTRELLNCSMMGSTFPMKRPPQSFLVWVWVDAGGRKEGREGGREGEGVGGGGATIRGGG